MIRKNKIQIDIKKEARANLNARLALLLPPSKTEAPKSISDKKDFINPLITYMKLCLQQKIAECNTSN